jgi:VanZ family protein
LPGAKRRPLQGGEELHEAKRSEDGGGALGVQGEKALHEAQRSENDRGVPSSQGEAELHVAQRSEDVRGEPISQRTTAWPLALTAICLIVYASLYPFTEWRDQGISPFRFLGAPLPQYWTGFDVAVNVVGYAPLGFLMALSALRSRRLPWAVTVAICGAALLSLTMEALQSYLPSRFPSNVDLALNTTGAWLGACCAWALEEAGVVDHWSRVRARWFATEARGALVLLALWPVALLFPAAVPLGLGQVFERLEAALADALANSPFLEWMPLREVELQPLVPLAELVCVALGALVPCLLAYGVVRTLWQRLTFSVAIFLSGVGASALSAALSYGPDHAWAWLELPVQVGLVLGAFLALVLLVLPRRGAAALALLALAINLGLLNQAPVDPYFAQTLQTWEQGRFIRFHGVVQWLGWLWPYAAMAYVLVRLSGRERA